MCTAEQTQTSVLETVVDISSRQIKLETRADNIEQHVHHIQVSQTLQNSAIVVIMLSVVCGLSSSSFFNRSCIVTNRLKLESCGFYEKVGKFINFQI